MNQQIICEHNTIIKLNDCYITNYNSIKQLECCNLVIELSLTENDFNNIIYSLNYLDRNFNNLNGKRLVIFSECEYTKEIVGNAQKEFDYLFRIYQNLIFE